MVKGFWQSGCYKVLRIMILIVFLPVVFCIFIPGMNMDYEEGLKLETILPNIILFLMILPVMLLCMYLIQLGGRFSICEKWNKRINVLLLLLSVMTFFLSYKMAKEIAFFLPWDIGVVQGFAYEIAAGNPLGDDSYLSVYTNNIPIAYLLGKMYKYAKETLKYSENPELIWIQGNCILMSLSIFFSCLTVKKLTKNIMAVFITFMMGFSLIGLSAWKVAAYTDTYGQLFPILCLYFYICFKQSSKGWRKIVLLTLSMICGGIGGLIKPNLFVVLIAVGLAELIELIGHFSENRKYFFVFCALLILTLISVKLYEKRIINEMGLELTGNLEAGMADYFYMGLNEEHTGSYNSGDRAVYGEFQFEARSERERIVFHRALERLKEKGFWGALYFWLRKMTMTFNDGMFGWQNEVWISGYYDPPIDSGTRLTGILRGIFWEGGHKTEWNTLIQFIWLFGIVGIPGICLCKRSDQSLLSSLFLCFLGIFFFQLLFETRARYLFSYLPVIIVICVTGIFHYSLAAGNLRHQHGTIRCLFRSQH